MNNTVPATCGFHRAGEHHSLSSSTRHSVYVRPIPLRLSMDRCCAMNGSIARSLRGVTTRNPRHAGGRHVDTAAASRIRGGASSSRSAPSSFFDNAAHCALFCRYQRAAARSRREFPSEVFARSFLTQERQEGD